MEILDPGIATVALFVGFGLLVGILFGCFGMGGSFLVTPALLVGGYPPTVAVGSGLAFVFGTGVIGALSHRDRGRVDAAVAASLVVGTTLGIGVGKRAVFLLDGLGIADVVVGAGSVGLLGAVGLFVRWKAGTDDTRTERVRGDDTRAERVGIGTGGRAPEVPPLISLPGGATVSVWIVLVVGLGTGVLSGCLGVGGGFLLVPAMIYGFGVPTAAAVGTSSLLVAIAGAFGTFVYAQSNAVDVPVVTALLAGSALGVRVGAGATRLVPDADVEGYFAVVLLAGSVAVASELLGTAYDLEALDAVGAVLLVGTAALVSAAIVRTSIDTLRENRGRRPSAPR